MGANHLFQLGHKISQGPLARVQPISKLRAYRHGFRYAVRASVKRCTCSMKALADLLN